LAGLKALREPRGRTRFLNLDEIDRLLAAYEELMLLEADQDLPPEIRKMDLRWICYWWTGLPDTSCRAVRVSYVFSVPAVLAVKRVEVSLKRGFVVTGRASRRS